MSTEVAGLSGGNPLYTVLLGEHLATNGARRAAPLDRRQLPAAGSRRCRRRRRRGPRARRAPRPARVDLLDGGLPGRSTSSAALLTAERAGLITGPADAMQFVHPLLPDGARSSGSARWAATASTAAWPPSPTAPSGAPSTWLRRRRSPTPHVAAALEAGRRRARWPRGARIEAGQRFERAGELTPAPTTSRPAGAGRWPPPTPTSAAATWSGRRAQAAIAVELAAGPVELAMAGGVHGPGGGQPRRPAPGPRLRHATCSACSRASRACRSFLTRARVRIEQTFDLAGRARHRRGGHRPRCAAAGDQRGAEVASVVAENCRFVLGLPDRSAGRLGAGDGRRRPDGLH